MHQTQMCIASIVMVCRKSCTSCGRSMAPPLQTIIVNLCTIPDQYCNNLCTMHGCALRAYRWFVARVVHFAGGARLRPYRPSLQEFRRHTRPVLQVFMHHTQMCIASMAVGHRKSCTSCGRSAAPPLQTIIASIYTPN